MDADRKKLLKVAHFKPRVSQVSIDEVNWSSYFLFKPSSHSAGSKDGNYSDDVIGNLQGYLE